MKKKLVAQELQAMAATPGVVACALVDVTTGMVYLCAGDAPNMEGVAEAASDYWRLYQRNGNNFAALGPLQAVSTIHRDGVVSLMPCSEGIVLATISRRMQLDMSAWFRKVTHLATLIAQ